LPFTTTAGTLSTPRLLALLAFEESFISKMLISQLSHAILLTNSMVLSQAGHPALKISTLFDIITS
jgi:hypothetical protein